MSTCWLIINLDQSADRWEMMQTQLDAVGRCAIRVRAIDAVDLSLDHQDIDYKKFWRNSGMRLRTTDAACYLSHLEAMRIFLASQHSHAVILEDDVTLGPDAPRLIDTLTSDLSPKDWDMVKLTGNSTLRVMSCRVIEGPFKLGVPWTRLPGAAAYLINRYAASRYLDRLCPISVLFDHAFDRGWALGLRTRVVAPLPANGMQSKLSRQSTIDTPDRPRVKNRGLGKATALWWRTKNETRRFAYAMLCWLRS